MPSGTEAPLHQRVETDRLTLPTPPLLSFQSWLHAPPGLGSEWIRLQPSSGGPPRLGAPPAGPPTPAATAPSRPPSCSSSSSGWDTQSGGERAA
jgi:hypothetical protein